jgi:hypothetical protein
MAGITLIGVGCGAPPGRATFQGVLADDELWRTAADELGEYIQQLERHLAWMRRRATLRKDVETATAVENMQKKLVVAKKHHQDLCQLCDQRLQDTPSAIACCQRIDELMNDLIEQHLTLMRRLRERRQAGSR